MHNQDTIIDSLANDNVSEEFI